MIGRHYKKHGYNCANFVSDWYKEKLGIDIPVVNEFGLSFVIWMRKNFTDVSQPENHCLVLMVNTDGSYHVGVYFDYGIYHNFKHGQRHGSVCKWTLGSVRAFYKRVSFHKWSQ